MSSEVILGMVKLQNFVTDYDWFIYNLVTTLAKRRGKSRLARCQTQPRRVWRMMNYLKHLTA